MEKLYDFDSEYSLYNTGERLLICKYDSFKEYILFINYNLNRINTYDIFWDDLIYKDKIIKVIEMDIEYSITCKEKIELSEYYSFVKYFNEDQGISLINFNKNFAALITKILINLLFK